MGGTRLEVLAVTILSGYLFRACTGTISSVDYDSAEPGDSAEAGTGGVRAVEDERAADEPAPPGGGTGGAASRAGSRADAGALDGGAGAGGGTPAEGVGVAGSSGNETFCDAVTEVFVLRCGGGSCHSNPSATIGDFAVGREEADSFVDVPSVRNPACGLIIDASDPSQSLILRKLIGDFPSPMCGGFMPVCGGDLTNAQIDCVASWVQQFGE